MKHDEIIAKFGGVTEMSRTLGHENRTTVQHWAKKRHIPKWRWHEVLVAARRKRLGLTEADFDGVAK